MARTNELQAMALQLLALLQQQMGRWSHGLEIADSIGFRRYSDVGQVVAYIRENGLGPEQYVLISSRWGYLLTTDKALIRVYCHWRLTTAITICRRVSIGVIIPLERIFPNLVALPRARLDLERTIEDLERSLTELNRV
jgi:hypothetical protein